MTLKRYPVEPGKPKPGMVWDIKQPCKSCPYRKDSKLKLWHPSEFVNLLKQDACIPGTDVSMGAMFGCHEYNKRPPETHRPCAGWLLDQKRRGLPNLNLRLTLSRNPLAAACFEAVSSAGLKLFRTMVAMCRANGVRPPASSVDPELAKAMEAIGVRVKPK